MKEEKVVFKSLEEELKSRIETFVDFPKKDVNFKDIGTILADPKFFRRTVDAITTQFEWYNVDAIVGFDARGFLGMGALEYCLSIPTIMARKEGKLPGELESEPFEKEYGLDYIFIQKHRIKPGMRIVIHDDLLATGGTGAAAARIIERLGAEVFGFSFVMELGFLEGRKVLEKFGVPIKSVVNFKTPEE